MFQSAMFGMFVALAFSIWLGVGAVFYRTYDMPKPAPTYNCTFPTQQTASNSTNMMDTHNRFASYWQRSICRKIVVLLVYSST